MRVALILCLALVHRAPESRADDWITLRTGMRVTRRMTHTLPPVPGGPWRAIGARLPLVDGGLATLRRDGALGVDLDRDGEPDLWCREKQTCVTLTLQYDDARRARYAIVIRRTKGAFALARACYRYARFRGTRLLLVDSDSDGRYDGVGRDAIIIGDRGHGEYLGRLLALGGTFYEFRVSPDGARLRLRPWRGPTAPVRVTTRLAPGARLSAALIGDGDRWFDAVRTPRVPPGTYRLRWGLVDNGTHRCHFSADLALEVGRGTPLSIGAPFRLDVHAERRGDRLWIDGRRLRVLGAGGVVFSDFARPLAPRCEVRDATTRQLIDRGRVGRSICGSPTGFARTIPTRRAIEVRCLSRELTRLLGPLRSDWLAPRSPKARD